VGQRTDQAADGSAVSNALVVATRDGGRTWSREPVPPGLPSMTVVACATVSTCFAAGLGTVISTHDAGSSWQVATGPTPTMQPEALACSTAVSCFAVGTHFVPDGAGGSYREPAVLATTDAGVTWTERRGPGSQNSTPYGIDCPTPSECVIVGHQ